MKRAGIPSAALAAALFLSACGDVAGPGTGDGMRMQSASAGAPATVDRGRVETPISGLVFLCSSEPFEMSGTLIDSWHTTALANGSWMTSQHVRGQISGVGTVSGTKFTGRAVGNTTQVYAVPNGGAFTYTSTYRGMSIVQGNADNDFFIVNARWTVDAHGRVVMDAFEVKWECRG